MGLVLMLKWLYLNIDEVLGVTTLTTLNEYVSNLKVV
jgi:hypothetical protein